MQKINVSKFLFISSNILYFFTILLTYLDLSKFNLSDAVNPTQFSLITYVVIIFFLVSGCSTPEYRAQRDACSG